MCYNMKYARAGIRRHGIVLKHRSVLQKEPMTCRPEICYWCSSDICYWCL